MAKASALFSEQCGAVAKVTKWIATEYGDLLQHAITLEARRDSDLSSISPASLQHLSSISEEDL
jgi:hypothetical protein